MTSSNAPHSAAALLCLLAMTAAAQETVTEWSGHGKIRGLLDTFPDNSVFQTIAGGTATGGELDLRLKFSARHSRWSIDADYQAFALAGDRVRLARQLGLAQGPATIGVLDDARRWFDLTQVVRERSDVSVLHRMDRLALGYTSDNTVLRLGRQALSWGGGLFFSPFDIVNPFDPAAVDTEYKTGDDMLYGQYLRANGDDVQIAWVVRRDPVSGDIAADEGTVAFKYHGIAGDSEYDVLIAENRGRTTLGFGGNRSLGGAIVRTDVLLAEADSVEIEALVNVSYSWTWRGLNMNGAVEYYYNGWGIGGGAYGPAVLLGQPELTERIARGETFTLGRHYLGAGVTVELTPLLLLTPNLFANLDDPSALLQVLAQYSLGDNLTFIGALNISLGPDGSEFGGVDAGLPGQYLSRSAGVFAQLGWYF
ncbi:MAG: hypothetical protein AAGA61_05415 [Pseudomonadota bacterium]